ncbi:MAG: purine-nucleoside phosphorylase [Candidatus Promineifilaceae bacterium]|nr:purine-nucleoside phosphorylase [Candidatus Promineifilaceae bacterium]
MSEFVTQEQVKAAAEFVRERTSKVPSVGLVLGSGLSSLADEISSADIVPVDHIPHWPLPTVVGHTGRLIIGQLVGKTVIVLQGRSHFYEGYSTQQVTLPVRVMIALGIKTLILTNAAGGMNPAFNPGDLMLINNHINMPGLAGQNPLRGPNDDSIGPRFPDMTEPYDRDLRVLAEQVAEENGFAVRQGVYAFVGGPSFETPAELRFLHMVGGDAVGMSTVPSVIVARHAGLRVLGISTITNMAVPDPEPGTFQNHEEVLETGRLVIPRLATLIRGVVGNLS